MRVLLAGATGTVGSALTEQLIAVGHEVLGLTRTLNGAARLERAGAQPLVADMMDAAALLEVVEGERADAVIHQATAMTKPPLAHRHLHRTDDLRDQGTANLLKAATAVGATRFLTQSFLFGYGYYDHGRNLLTEDAPFGEPTGNRFDRHLESMRSNEDQVFNTPGIEGVSLRYGMFYGSEPTTLALMDQLRKGRMGVPKRTGAMSPIHIDDAASAAVAALERGRGGEAYNIADDEPLTWTAYLDLLSQASAGRPARRIPAWIMGLSPYMGALVTRTSVALDNSKAKRELGWKPSHPTASVGIRSIARTPKAR